MAGRARQRWSGTRPVRARRRPRRGMGRAARPLWEMSPRELGALFPIVLAEYDPAWPARYAAEAALIETALGPGMLARISHIGSTAVPGMLAKPTIDILLEVYDDVDGTRLVRSLTEMGYHHTLHPERPPPHLMFMKGYTPRGFVGQAFHVHVRFQDDWPEFSFRDYLAGHPAEAERYAALKRRLQARHRFDREAYTDGKTAFIRAVMTKLRKGFPNDDDGSTGCGSRVC